MKLELNLPWKPILAWPWGVTYVVDPDSFLVTKHIESWDIEPWKVSSFCSLSSNVHKARSFQSEPMKYFQGVAQIFRLPTVKVGKKK